MPSTRSFLCEGSRKIAREVLEVDAKVVDGVVNLTGLLTLGSGEGTQVSSKRAGLSSMP